jgi:hypothetical protein
MKRSILLLALMLAPGFSGKNVAFSHQAAAAGAPSEGLGARPVFEYRTEYLIDSREEMNHRNEIASLAAGPINEVEVKRLKLMFLLIMSLGPYRAPGH